MTRKARERERRLLHERVRDTQRADLDPRHALSRPWRMYHNVASFFTGLALLQEVGALAIIGISAPVWGPLVWLGWTYGGLAWAPLALFIAVFAGWLVWEAGRPARVKKRLLAMPDGFCLWCGEALPPGDEPGVCDGCGAAYRPHLNRRLCEMTYAPYRASADVFRTRSKWLWGRAIVVRRRTRS